MRVGKGVGSESADTTTGEIARQIAKTRWETVGVGRGNVYGRERGGREGGRTGVVVEAGI